MKFKIKKQVLVFSSKYWKLTFTYLGILTAKKVPNEKPANKAQTVKNDKQKLEESMHQYASINGNVSSWFGVLDCWQEEYIKWGLAVERAQWVRVLAHKLATWIWSLEPMWQKERPDSRKISPVFMSVPCIPNLPNIHKENVSSSLSEFKYDKTTSHLLPFLSDRAESVSSSTVILPLQGKEFYLDIITTK